MALSKLSLACRLASRSLVKYDNRCIQTLSFDPNTLQSPLAKHALMFDYAKRGLLDEHNMVSLIKYDPSIVVCIPNIKEKYMSQAVHIEPKLIHIIKNPSYSLQTLAISINPQVFLEMENKTEELSIFALKCEKRTDEYLTRIFYSSIISSDVILECIKKVSDTYLKYVAHYAIKHKIVFKEDLIGCFLHRCPELLCYYNYLDQNIVNRIIDNLHYCSDENSKSRQENAIGSLYGRYLKNVPDDIRKKAIMKNGLLLDIFRNSCNIRS